MKLEFIKFPRTPHLVWLGERSPRDDKLLTSLEARDFASKPLVVEEKVDGTNVGFSVDDQRLVRAQHRGDYLRRPARGEFEPLWAWLDVRREKFAAVLGSDLVLFGEWCFAVHSVRYEKLPDWFLGFDVYERKSGRFFSVKRRNELLSDLGVSPVPDVARDTFSLQELRSMLGKSRLSNGPMEGLYLRLDDGDYLAGRAKIVNPRFAESIDEHWTSKALRKNSLAA